MPTCEDLVSNEDLANAKLDATTIAEIATSRAGGIASGAIISSAVDRFGDVSSTVFGQLSKMGYEVPVDYAGSIVFTVDDSTKTIDRDGVIYAPYPSSLPFTTTGTWVSSDEDDFYVIQRLKDSGFDDYVQVRLIDTSSVASNDLIFVTDTGIAGPFVLRNIISHGLTDNDGTIIVIDANWYGERIYSGAVDARWFRARFDGVTDDTAALAAMRAAHPTESYIMPDGSYVEDSLLKVNSEPVIATALGKGLDKTPFYLLWSGQSNAAGTANVPAGFLGTSNEVEDGVYVWSNSTNAWVIPVWGNNPLASSGSNNAGIRAANEIKRQTGRDVYMVLSARGGISIEEWVGLGTSSDMWSGNQRDVLTQLTNSGMPRIDLVGWSQGEADHDTAGGSYNTYALYKSALETLIAQFKALPQWTSHSQFITSGIGEWYDMLLFSRNDVLLTLNNWDDSQVSNISTHGSVRNPDAGQSSHFDHDSLTLIGKRVALQALGDNVGNPNGHTSIRRMQGATTPFYGVVASQIIDIDPQNLKGGAYFQGNNSTFNFADAYRFDGATVIINVTTLTAGNPCIVNIAATSSIVYEGVTQPSITCDRKGEWVFKSMNGTLYLVKKPDVISLFSEYTVASGSRLLTLSELNNSVWRVDDATLNLPSPDLLTNATISIISFANSTSTIGVPSASNKFYNSSGSLVSSLSLTAAGNMVRLRAMNTRWAVEFQNY